MLVLLALRVGEKGFRLALFLPLELLVVASRDHTDLLDNWGLDAALELGRLRLQLPYASRS